MNLKQAREKNKLAQFIREREKDTPSARMGGNLHQMDKHMISFQLMSLSQNCCSQTAITCGFSPSAG